MGRSVQISNSSVTLKLSGFLRFCALKSRVEMPYKIIKDIKVEIFKAPLTMIRLPGTSMPPLHIHEGSFLHNGDWYFLSYEKKKPVVIIELEGHKKYRYVVFETENPDQLVVEIKEKLKEVHHSSS
ncbi:hypothetical protein [Priestia aryabhattai]